MRGKRHAYLVLAHGGLHELRTLLEFIDDERNDIFVHLDKKWAIDESHFDNVVSRSALFFAERVNVSWGGSTMIDAEIALFSTALKTGNYSYFHLLSGVDLPVKSQDYIHDFFDRHEGEIFLEPVDYEGTNRFRMRYEQYHLLQNKLVGRKRNVWKYVDFASCYLQRMCGVRRFRDKSVHAAWQWVSLPLDVVQYLVANASAIHARWKMTYCCDELFIPTEIAGTEFNARRSPLGSLRFAEWEWQGPRDFAPRPLDDRDLSIVEKQTILFARKFVHPHSDSLVRLLRGAVL